MWEKALIFFGQEKNLHSSIVDVVPFTTLWKSILCVIAQDLEGHNVILEPHH